ncbi:hypothetical protein CHS0354_004867 [Potamilus streckersoni]|uniref:PH domain-containing protein n=1 Tax=Potamilus streckersoni TaxID=2493646 RepID=A0AAE0SA14_9BIVA|nr:hypothetical protein CHS0354_004867 [Potamilus streckersoni]
MENDNPCLKSGFLYKKILDKKWKICWFVLLEDKLTCHDKKDKSLLLDTIPLQGASVVCPCLHEPEINTDCAFKLQTPGGEELYFQGADSQDRDQWAHGIGAVIRSLSTSSQVSKNPVQFKHFRVTANVSEVLGAIQDEDAGVALTNQVRNGIVHKNCFQGSDLVEWLLRWSIVRKREDGQAMGQTLLLLGHIQEVDLEDGTAGVSWKFSDGDKLYRFTSLNLGVKRNSYFDSSDSDSTISDDGEQKNVQEKLRKGRMIKCCFLLKKKSLRKGWRVVRVCTRENPSSLEYAAVKSILAKERLSEAVPGKIWNLNCCFLTSSSRGNTAINPLHDIKGQTSAHKKRVYLKVRGKKCLVFQAKDEEEWYELISLLFPLCSAGTVAAKAESDQAENEMKDETSA